MKHLLLFILLLLPAMAGAQSRAVFPQDTFITRDSLPRMLLDNWRFNADDDPSMALPEYNDQSWPVVNSLEVLRVGDTRPFKGIGWLRLHFTTDSSIASKPVTMQLTQLGASQIYLDGKLIKSYGIINGRDSSEYYDPQFLPFPVSISPGRHVLAIRYANYNVLSKSPVYSQANPGLRMSISQANSAIETAHDQTAAIGVIFMTLFGIFTALFLLHLIFFLYNRSDHSNLLFSLFSLCLALVFIMPFLLKIIHDPAWLRHITYYSFFLLVLVFFSLSGFLNMLFARKKLRFRIISACCLLAMLIYLYNTGYGYVALVVNIAGVSLEAVLLIIGAMIRKRPGANIIGAGLLLLAGFTLIIIIRVLAQGDFLLNDSELSGKIIELLMVVAILSIPVSMSAFLARNFSVVSKDLKVQLVQVQDLSQKALEQEAEKQRLLESRKDELEQEVMLRTKEVIQQKEEIEAQHTALKAEKKKTDDLLLNILPEEVAEELKETGSSAARLYDNVSVLFTDFVDFTQMSEHLTPSQLVAEIDHCFKAFDDITGRYGLEKIKTVGDAYIAVSGLPVTNDLHAHDVVKAAIAIRDFIVARKEANPASFTIRLGIHSGPVVAGIVGVKKFAYDIWGDTVNTAARMEQHSEPGRVNISSATYNIIKDEFACTYRGEIEAKHKGRLGMYFVETTRH